MKDKKLSSTKKMSQLASDMNRVGLKPSDFKMSKTCRLPPVLVTPQDIRGAVTGSTDRCWAARAAWRVWQAKNVFVTRTRIYVQHDDGKCMVYEHNGKIPETMDQGRASAVGLILKPRAVRPSGQEPHTQSRDKARKYTGRGRARFVSMAAINRSSARVDPV